MKFKLALKVSTDPVTAVGTFLVAGAKQAGNTPNYGQGGGAYGKRFGAVAADGFSDIMIGGAILPFLLHQDPRYFYQGTGTTGSRIRHAVFSPFVARGDNGTWQPNYSSLGGDLRHQASPTFTIRDPIVVSGWSSEILRSAPPKGLARAWPRSSCSASSPAEVVT
jgi:hypothetical protein